MSAVYAAMLEIEITQNVPVVSASIKGVAAISTPTRNTKRERLAAPATTRTGGRGASRAAPTGGRRMPRKRGAEAHGEAGRDVRRGATHSPNDHGHEGDEDGHEGARPQGTEDVDPEVAADARWQ